MEEKKILYDTAVLAKEKGFDLYQKFSYWECELTDMTPGFPLDNGKTSQKNYWDFKRYYAPTQSLLQKWLREKHKIEVEVYRTHKMVTGENYGCQGEKWNKKDKGTDDLFNLYAKTYEEALEKGLYEALKLIK